MLRNCTRRASDVSTAVAWGFAENRLTNIQLRFSSGVNCCSSGGRAWNASRHCCRGAHENRSATQREAVCTFANAMLYQGRANL